MEYLISILHVQIVLYLRPYIGWIRSVDNLNLFPPADKAYREMKSMKCSQSIIVSGEPKDHMIHYDVMMTSR